MKFVRKPNRIYTTIDFEDGEEIEFAYHSFVPSSKAKGYAFYRSKKDGRTILLTPDDVAYCQDHPTEKGETERQIQTAKTMIEKMVSCYDKIEKGGEE